VARKRKGETAIIAFFLPAENIETPRRPGWRAPPLPDSA
jgi:hypothetical protein